MRKLLTYGVLAILATHAAAAYLVYVVTDPGRGRGRAAQEAPPAADGALVLPTLQLREPVAMPVERLPEVAPVIVHGPAPEVIQSAPAILMPANPEDRGDALVAARQERKELAIEALNERAQARMAAAEARKAAMAARAARAVQPSGTTKVAKSR